MFRDARAKSRPSPRKVECRENACVRRDPTNPRRCSSPIECAKERSTVYWVWCGGGERGRGGERGKGNEKELGRNTKGEKEDDKDIYKER